LLRFCGKNKVRVPINACSLVGDVGTSVMGLFTTWGLQNPGTLKGKKREGKTVARVGGSVCGLLGAAVS